MDGKMEGRTDLGLKERRFIKVSQDLVKSFPDNVVLHLSFLFVQYHRNNPPAPPGRGRSVTEVGAPIGRSYVAPMM
jgi:hypothetical protein